MEVDQNAMKFVIVQHIADISRENNEWKKELNLVGWHDREPVYDIRTWNGDYSKYWERRHSDCGRGGGIEKCAFRKAGLLMEEQRAPQNETA